MNKVKERLIENGLDEEIIIFDDPSFEDAIVGITYDSRVIYDYDLMVKWLVDNKHMSEEEAIDEIEYNTVRSLSYMTNAPIVMYKLK